MSQSNSHNGTIDAIHTTSGMNGLYYKLLIWEGLGLPLKSNANNNKKILNKE